MRQIAGVFPATEYPNILIGLGEPDDAAVYKLDDERALIKTTDFFTPVVDDPYTYGAIAAANSMSDVYAMGGEVILCLNIAGFPDNLEPAVMAAIFAGGAAKVKEAGAAIAGGHTVTNPEPFYGLSVTGLIHPQRVVRKGGAQPGDQIFLTKPLGTGIITTAAKITGPGESRAHRLARRAYARPDCDPAHLQAAIDSMTLLNRAAAQAGPWRSSRSGPGRRRSCASSGGMAGGMRSAECGVRIWASEVPTLLGVWEYIAAGYLTRGSTSNPEHFAAGVRFADSVTDAQRTLLWEAETSGGLLLAVPQENAELFRAACAERSQKCWQIGEVVAGISGIEVV